MDITILAAWGELLGGIGVIASLVYLARQIQQNSKLLRASTTSAATQSKFIMDPYLVQDPEVARIFGEGARDYSSLSEAERRCFDPLLAILLRGHAQYFRFAQEGIINPELWKDQEQEMRWSTRQPGIRQWWAHWAGEMFRDDFRAYYEALIREGEAAE